MQKLTALFSDPDFIATVASEKISYPANSPIVEEGDEGQDLFIIRHGEVEVSYNLHDDAYDQPARITRLADGDVFGELSMFDGGPRSAEVKALTDCEVFKVDGPALIAYLDGHPATGYFVLRELFMRLIMQMRQNNLRTKMALQMYFHEHADD
ncbi:cyclic nucleotide-binding domain-containing protein [Methylomonas sp. LL1]|uniref:cyclic nucleotide-binding domain-containing protein n=1 Tax=Methylomonas sp. LL1 TaxID=2785785 RepID=UPI0018C410E7|nr:cyclic nucleotide-binding domain-containing protein [Methylomonas sp. LL1]QPK64282.1 cyclic nucleotide-binding domain-containing protein [Methylomonas sp. LL1]